jgi:hypothetical protein
MTPSWAAYRRERFPLPLFAPIALALALFAQLGSEIDPLRAAHAFGCALLLLAQFRLWDDLADRERDRMAHPGRALVRAVSVAPFVAGCVGLAALNLAAATWRGAGSTVLFLVAVDAAALAWYACRPATRSIVTDLVLLAKYPAFVVVLSAGASTSRLLLTLSAASAYALACAYEAWHDPSAPLREVAS